MSTAEELKLAERRPGDYLHGRRKPYKPTPFRLPLLQYLTQRADVPRNNISYLRQRLERNTGEFERALQNMEIRYRQDKLPVTIANRRVWFAGFAASANRQPAYNGYKSVTVDQHYYSRHKISLVYPELQTLVSRINDKCLVYIPMELLDVVINYE
jgi:hypothetical protein